MNRPSGFEGNQLIPVVVFPLKMTRASIGIRTHSGWAVLVAVTCKADSVEVLARRRAVIAAADIPGSKQPYHTAESIGLPKAERFLAECTAASERLASAAIRELVNDLRAQHLEVAGAAVLLASGRPLPELPRILASHALIHTAEGEFYRGALRHACEALGLPVTGVPERGLADRAPQHVQHLSNLGHSIGPPWTADHKAAALAAALLLA